MDPRALVMDHDPTSLFEGFLVEFIAVLEEVGYFVGTGEGCEFHGCLGWGGGAGEVVKCASCFVGVDCVEE